MTDGVARELEQAEARLESVRVRLWDLINAELRSALENGKAALSIRTDIVECIERDWPNAAIEVGRLRALAVTDAALSEIASLDFVDLRAHGISVGDKAIGIAHAALAAREEVTG